MDCTTLMYVFCKFFKKIYIYKQVAFLDFFVFWMSLFVNILLLIFAFSIDLKSFLLVLGVELIGVFSSFVSNDSNMVISSKKKKRGNNKKKRIKNKVKSK